MGPHLYGPYTSRADEVAVVLQEAQVGAWDSIYSIAVNSMTGEIDISAEEIGEFISEDE